MALERQPLRTLDEAHRFIETVGFCLMYPMRPPLLAPTFIGAWTGSDKHLPAQQHAYADPRAVEATEVMVRLLRNHDAYEANQFEENNAFLVAGSIFPYFYALVGERNPRQAPQPKPRSEYSQLACDAFELIRRAGPISKQQMREDLGGSISFVALDHALGELWSKLRITRVDYKPEDGAFWDVLYRWAPDAVAKASGCRWEKRCRRCCRNIWIASSPLTSRKWNHSSAILFRAPGSRKRSTRCRRRGNWISFAWATAP